MDVSMYKLTCTSSFSNRHFFKGQKIKSELKKTLRTCSNGHKYFKSSDCPTCPVCEEAKKPKEGFLSLLSAPARRALVNANITTLAELSQHSERDILKLHGVGKTTIPRLQNELKKVGLAFAK